MVSLPYEKDFNEKQIPTKARSIQMNPELLEYCKKEINDLFNKKLIRPSVRPEKFQFMEKWQNCNFDYKIVISVKNP